MSIPRETSTNWQHGPFFIDESFANLRGPGEAIGFHSGGNAGVIRNQFRYENSRFHCGQVNILMDLTDIGPGTRSPGDAAYSSRLKTT